MSRDRVKHKGRSNTKGRFALVPTAVLESDACKSLSHAAFRVLVLLAAEFTGHNNGALGLTASQAKAAGISSDKTLYRSLSELQIRALIEQIYPASRVPPRPTMWALSWRPWDDTKYCNATRVASNAYRNWQPEAMGS